MSIKAAICGRLFSWRKRKSSGSVETDGSDSVLDDHTCLVAGADLPCREIGERLLAMKVPLNAAIHQSI